MNQTSEPSTAGGCGSSACQCTTATPATAMVQGVARINGVALHPAGQQPDADTLRELAHGELLRQEAVRTGLLPRQVCVQAPELDDPQRSIIEAMLDAAVLVPTPTLEECQRYHASRKQQLIIGQAVRLRHILFAVTPGVNVRALTGHADQALLGLLHNNAPAGLFAQRAAELSNCPSSANGGNLGWIEPADCAPELAQALFYQTEALPGLGVHARLIHTRFGFHIIDILERKPGRAPAFEEVSERLAAQLSMQARARALHQYMSLLAGAAELEGITLNAVDSPLVQ